MIITGFQLRASRKTLNLTLDELSNAANISKVTLARLINTIGNNDEITCLAQDAQRLLIYFCNKKLLFVDQYTIELDEYVEPKPIEMNLTRFQFIAARTATNLSLRGLEQHIDLSYGSFRRFEEQDNTSYIKSNKTEISKFILFFNESGIYFPNNKSIRVNEKKKI